MKHLAMALVLVWTCRSFGGLPQLNDFRNSLPHEQNASAIVLMLPAATTVTCPSNNCAGDIVTLATITLEYRGTCREAAENQCGELPAECQESAH